MKLKIPGSNTPETWCRRFWKWHQV